MGRRRNTIDSILERVDVGGANDCWEWQGCRDRGYGRTSIGNVSLHAHRVIFAHFNGPIPDGLIVRHRCDNPPCCNPAHLELGTHYDNAHDKIARGRARSVRGEGHPAARLTERDVRSIRSRLGAGETQSALAREFGITKVAVHAIHHRKTWGWLP